MNNLEAYYVSMLAERAPAQPAATHAPDCEGIRACGGIYRCNRCERDFGWCAGAFDDTPALCDECANLVQGDAS